MKYDVIFFVCVSSSVCAQETVSWNQLNYYQDGKGNLLSQFTNPSIPNTDPFGQPNSHFPWLHPGGVPGDNQVVPNFGKLIEYDFPNGKPSVFQTKGVLPPSYLAPNDLTAWKFPVGTVARARLFSSGKEFAVHESTKVKEGIGIECWEGAERILNTPPSWYKSPDNCVDCHKDVGKHARILHPKRENYYHWLRGSDGRFSWHPFIR